MPISLMLRFPAACTVLTKLLVLLMAFVLLGPRLELKGQPYTSGNVFLKKKKNKLSDT